MGWPYKFLPLTPDEKHLRRETINWYAAIAHISSILFPLLIFVIYSITSRLSRSSHNNNNNSIIGNSSGRRRGASIATASDRDNESETDEYGQYYADIPGSPGAKADRGTLPGSLMVRWRRLAWWVGDDVWLSDLHLGQKDQWLLGTVWMAWLLALCIAGTGQDYFHLTKRFGAIAVSQFPMQYLLSLKSISPLSYLFRSSHEQINRYHRVLGRLIYILLVLHMLFYLSYFAKAGTLLSRPFEPVVLCGVIASLGMHALSGTALAKVRRNSYRLFFVVHLVAALFVPPLIFFHAPSERLYVAESMMLFMVDLVVRKTKTVFAPATVEVVPGTNLLKVSASVPIKTVHEFRAHPGSHIYLSIPPESRHSAASKSPVFNFLYNPFTVASFDENSSQVTLVARQRSGPTSEYLASLISDTSASHLAPTTSLGLEGPYGIIGKHFEDLLNFGAGRILIIAGGVGATFALPVYRALLRDSPAAHVQLVWAIRTAGEATWAVTSSSTSSSTTEPNTHVGSVLQDPHVQLFLTGDMGLSGSAYDEAVDGTQGYEMSSAATRGWRTGGSGGGAAGQNRKRPNLQHIVDDTFRQGLEEPVAVLVCGPAEMARETRRRVRPWAMRGRKIWWHDETFGW